MDAENWKQNLERRMDYVFGQIPKRNVNFRKAYIGGVYFVLTVAVAYVECDTPFVDHVLWYELSKSNEETLSVRDLIYAVNHCSYGKIYITEKMIPQPDLRYGSPGEFYAKGVKTGVDGIIMAVIPFLEKTYPRDSFKMFMEWADSEMIRLNSL